MHHLRFACPEHKEKKKYSFLEQIRKNHRSHFFRFTKKLKILVFFHIVVFGFIDFGFSRACSLCASQQEFKDEN